MDSAAEPSKLDQKLTGALNDIVDKHKASILPLLMGKSTDLSYAVLKNDDTVRKVAGFCYGMLPGPVRFVVKEHVFVDFVMNNREKLLGKLVAQKEAGCTPADLKDAVTPAH